MDKIIEFPLKPTRIKKTGVQKLLETTLKALSHHNRKLQKLLILSLDHKNGKSQLKYCQTGMTVYECVTVLEMVKKEMLEKTSNSR